jgi:hypothetical protein
MRTMFIHSYSLFNLSLHVYYTFPGGGGGGDGEGRQCRAACRLRRVNIAKADKVDACGIGFKIISNFYVREQKISNIISDLCEHSNILNE